MKTKSYLLLAGCALVGALLSYSATAIAQQHGAPQISDEKMESIRACASAKGVEMPAPPPHGERGGRPPEDGQAGHNQPPKLSDADRAIMDACFKANGVTPPGPREPKGK